MDEAEGIDVEKITGNAKYWAQEDDTLSRVHHLGADTHRWRESIGYPAAHGDNDKKFHEYIHRTGGQVMQTQYVEPVKNTNNNVEENKDAIDIKLRNKRAGKILRRKIKVEDVEDGLVEILMDKEWDTTGWNESEIMAGCDYLVSLFEKDSDEVNHDKAERALMMLEKLVFRHVEAKEYMKINLDIMIGKAANRRIKGGKSESKLKVLDVIAAMQHLYTRELSVFNFAGRFLEMALLEVRLATTLIQHTYRAMRERRKPKHNVNPAADGFGSDEEMARLRARAINTRSIELRHRWHIMHWVHKPAIGGVRGPVHVGATFMVKALAIFQRLVSRTASGVFAPSNCEDILNSFGSILLSSFVAVGYSGPFSKQSVHVLYGCSRQADGYYQMLCQGCVDSCYRFAKMIRQRYNDDQEIKNQNKSMLNLSMDMTVEGDNASIASKTSNNKTNTTDVKEIVDSLDSELYLNCWKSIEFIAIHAAGCHRAELGYDYITPANDDHEKIDYSVTFYLKPSRVDRKWVQHMLAPNRVHAELSEILRFERLIEPLRVCTRVLLAMSCGVCYSVILDRVTADGALLMRRLLEMLEESDDELANTTLALFLQLCTTSGGRDLLLTHQIDKLLQPLLIIPRHRKTNKPNYKCMPHLRAMALCVALSRQREWRNYNPVNIVSFLDTPAKLTELIYMDLLFTLRQPPLDMVRPTYNQLASMNSDQVVASYMSGVLARMDPEQVGNFISHPEDPKWFYQFDWSHATCMCAIMEGISANPKAATAMFSAGTVNFIGKCLNLAKFEFVGKRMKEDEMIIIFNGVFACTNCMSYLCDTGGHGGLRRPENREIFLEGSRDAHMVDAAGYFIKLLGIKHPELSDRMKHVQERAGFAVVNMLTRFGSMLISGDPQTPDIRDMLPVGSSLSTTLRELRNIYGTGQKMLAYLDRLLRFMTIVATPSYGSNMAINQWKIFDSLRAHLPPPLSGLGERSLSRALSNARKIKQGSGVSSSPGVNARRSSNDMNRNSIVSNSSYSLLSHPTMANNRGSTNDYAFKEDEGYIKYRKGLGTLSEHFFDTLATLCQLEQGRDLTISEGFLRRCLDKAHLLLPAMEGEFELKEWGDLIAKGKAELVPKSPEREEMASCLRLLAQVASHHSSKAGAANDVVMGRFYDTVGITTHLIGSHCCPRSDHAYIAAMHVLAKLSRDTSRCAEPFRDDDVVGILRGLLQEVDVHGEIIPDECLQHLLDCCLGISQGFWGEHLATQLPMLRLPLTRVSRLRPTFASLINDINFAISRNQRGLLAKDVTDFMDSAKSNGLANEQPYIFGAAILEQDEFEVPLTGDADAEHAWNQLLVEQNEDEMAIAHRLQVERESSGVSIGSKNMNKLHNNSKSRAHNRTPTPNNQYTTLNSTRRTNFVRTKAGEELELEDTPATGYPGYYTSCGIGSCGSLRFPGTPCQHCGFVTLNEEEQKKELLKLPMTAAVTGKAEVSKLSARDPELRKRMKDLKIRQGLMDRRLAFQKPDDLSEGKVASEGLLGDLDSDLHSQTPHFTTYTGTNTDTKIGLESLTKGTIAFGGSVSTAGDSQMDASVGVIEGGISGVRGSLASMSALSMGDQSLSTGGGTAIGTINNLLDVGEDNPNNESNLGQSNEDLLQLEFSPVIKRGSNMSSNSSVKGNSNSSPTTRDTDVDMDLAADMKLSHPGNKTFNMNMNMNIHSTPIKTKQKSSPSSPSSSSSYKNKAMKSPFINDSSSSSSSMRKIKNSRNSTTLVTQLDLQDVPELSLTRPTRPSPMRK